MERGIGVLDLDELRTTLGSRNLREQLLGQRLGLLGDVTWCCTHNCVRTGALATRAV